MMVENITDKILSTIEYMIKQAVKDLKLDRHVFGVVATEQNGKYVVYANNGVDVHTDVKTMPYLKPAINDVVSVLVPNGDYTRMVIDNILGHKGGG